MVAKLVQDTVGVHLDRGAQGPLIAPHQAVTLTRMAANPAPDTVGVLLFKVAPGPLIVRHQAVTLTSMAVKLALDTVGALHFRVVLDHGRLLASQAVPLMV
jgi:hypothetical protein